MLLAVIAAFAGSDVASANEAYQPIPGLSAKDRAVLAANMVQQGQCRNGLVEIREAMKELPEDETLLRLKGACETDMVQDGAQQTIMHWLKVAPQNHPERGKMLTLLAKTQAAKEDPTEWVLVPAGEFSMGAEGAPATADEGPKHKVYLDAFYIGKYEVSNRQYHTFVKATGHRFPDNSDPKYDLWRGDTMLEGVADLPTVNVSWDDADAYCKWAGGRLPTEAEWEKAARGTDGRSYPWGNELVSANRANFSIDPVAIWDGIASLGKVDQYEYGRSPYGAYEMAGNVWEWVQDWYDEAYYKNSPDKNPQGPASGQARVIRGGSWQNNAETLRSANRNKQGPAERRIYIGFRCAKDAHDVRQVQEAVPAKQVIETKSAQ
jgi:formylglycine-generating enzyme required for sulfatase activity